MSRRFLVAVPIALLAVGGSTACATKKFVRTSVGQVNDKVDSLGRSLEETQERTRRNEGKIAEVDQKVAAADQKASAAGQAAAQANTAAGQAATAVRASSSERQIGIRVSMPAISSTCVTLLSGLSSTMRPPRAKVRILNLYLNFQK